MNWLLATTACLLAGGTAFAQAPEGFPADYNEIVEAAQEEGRLIVYAPFDQHELQPLFDAFSERYPGIAVEYNDLSTPVIFNRFISEVAAGGQSADFLFSSAVDMQVKLVADGFAMEYEPVEAEHYADELNMDNLAFTVMNEPICWTFNERLIPEEARPTSHADLAEKLRAFPEIYDGKIVSYDIEKSGVGFFNVHNDLRVMGETVFGT